MSEQVNFQRIGAYTWGLVLAVAGGALIIGALGGSPGEKPSMVFTQEDAPPPIIAAEPDGAVHTTGTGAVITHVSNPE